MFHFRRALALATTGLLALGAAGCGDDSPDSTDTPGAAFTTDAPASSPDTPTTDPAPSAPALAVATKIISLSPTATEMLFAIGAGDQVIAVDDQSTFPPEAAEKMTALSGFTPNIEAIAAYEPDLVVIGDDTQDVSGQLAALGIAVWVGLAAEDLDDIYDQIEQLGVATGRVAEAAELVGQMQTDIEAAIDGVPEMATPASYYHELDPTFFSANSSTFIGHVYGLFGLRNIADTAEGAGAYPQLSAEFIISQDPDLIFLADTKCCDQSLESVAARDGWGSISAVANGNVVAIDDDVASRWGPRIVEYIEAVAGALARVGAPAGG